MKPVTDIIRFEGPKWTQQERFLAVKTSTYAMKNEPNVQLQAYRVDCRD